MGRTVPSVPSGLNTTASAAGTLPASGVSSTDMSSGPWRIEEQRIDLTYVRVPGFAASSWTYSLSAPDVGWRVPHTYMHVYVQATVSVKKSYDWFSTASFQQLQTFQYNPVAADAYGSSYGGVGVSALGPNGSVNTLQPWYSRKLWNDTLDSSSFSACVGTSHYYYVGKDFASSVMDVHDGMEYWGEFERQSPKSSQAHTWIADWMAQSDSMHNLYQLAGPYSVLQETPLAMQNFVDQCGTIVTNEEYYGLPIGVKTVTFGTSTWYVGDPNTGIPEYDISKHGWV